MACGTREQRSADRNDRARRVFPVDDRLDQVIDTVDREHTRGRAGEIDRDGGTGDHLTTDHRPDAGITGLPAGRTDGLTRYPPARSPGPLSAARKL